MSNITDVVIHLGGSVIGDIYAPVPTRYERTAGNDFHQYLKWMDAEYAGGGKVFTDRIFAGSFNNLCIDEFIDWFKNLHPYRATVSIFGEDIDCVLSILSDEVTIIRSDYFNWGKHEVKVESSTVSLFS